MKKKTGLKNFHDDAPFGKSDEEEEEDDEGEGEEDDDGEREEVKEN